MTWLSAVLFLFGLVLGGGAALAYLAYDTARFDRTRFNAQVREEAEVATPQLARSVQWMCEVLSGIAAGNISKSLSSDAGDVTR